MNAASTTAAKSASAIRAAKWREDQKAKKAAEAAANAAAGARLDAEEAARKAATPKPSLRKSTTFTKGSGAYKCGSCSRTTRDDGFGDSVNARLCTGCYELAGLENQLQDDPESITVQDLANARLTMLDIDAKGGTVGTWATLEADLVAELSKRGVATTQDGAGVLSANDFVTPAEQAPAAVVAAPVNAEPLTELQQALATLRAGDNGIVWPTVEQQLEAVAAQAKPARKPRAAAAPQGDRPMRDFRVTAKVVDGGEEMVYSVSAVDYNGAGAAARAAHVAGRGPKVRWISVKAAK